MPNCRTHLERVVGLAASAFSSLASTLCIHRPRALTYGSLQVTKPLGFIERHGLWTDDQKRQAEELKRRVENGKPAARPRRLGRSARGVARQGGDDPGVHRRAGDRLQHQRRRPRTLDSANARTFASFTRGGGIGLDEMTGSPNLTIVPDPSTFRVLPWAPGIGWVLGDEYFNSGVPFHFSPRQLLRRQLKRLADKGMDCRVGLEIEWYLLRVAQDHLTDDQHRRSGRARAADQDLAGRAGLFLSLRIQHGSDAAGALGAGRGIRQARPAAALDRERVGTRPGRVHVRGAIRARGRRRRACCSAPRPGRSAGAWAISPPSWPGRRSRATTRAAGTCTSRWSMRRAGSNLFMPERERRSALAARLQLRRRAAAARRRRQRLRDARPSTAIDAIARTRWRPTGRPGATTTAA